MSRSIPTYMPAPADTASQASFWTAPRALRTLLLAGVCAFAGVATWWASPGSSATSDPELVTLLQGMAAIKGMGVLAATAVLWWRFGLAVPSALAVTYLACIWLAAAATVCIWQMAHLAAAAVVFHVCEITLLVAAWRDAGTRSRAR
jgi:hypothetical protein